jgi:hypothetical protein
MLLTKKLFFVSDVATTCSLLEIADLRPSPGGWELAHHAHELAFMMRQGARRPA